MQPAFPALANKFKFVLASKSPRRRQILQELGLRFSVKTAETPEQIRDFWYGRDIRKVVREKLDAIPEKKNTIYIACDTIVVQHGRVFGKPASKAQARIFLNKLSGKKHKVISCVGVKVVGRQNRYYLKTAKTDVFFRRLSQKEIEAHVNSKASYDKAVGYVIQNSA